MVEEDIQETLLPLHFECDLLLLSVQDETALQSVERGDGRDSKLMIVLHGVSLAISQASWRQRGCSELAEALLAKKVPLEQLSGFCLVGLRQAVRRCSGGDEGPSVRESDRNKARRLKAFASLPIKSDRNWDVKMEIAPVPGIRALTAVRAPQAEMRAPAIFDIDPSSRPGDGAEQRNGRKAAGAEENEEDDLALEGETAGAGVDLEAAPARQVDYFA